MESNLERAPGGDQTSSSAKRGGRLVWIDLEMTGLNPDTDVIIEIASLVTDPDLNILSEGPAFAIRHDAGVLDRMDDWNQKQHRKSGLVDRVLASPIDTAAAEIRTLEFLAQHAKSGAAVLCGNSVWQDRRFLARYMPTLERFFHYRMVDVSSFKVLATFWYPALPPFKKSDAHLALSDIRESVGELRYYRENIFSPAAAPPTA